MEATCTSVQGNVLPALHEGGGTTNSIHSHTFDVSRGRGQWCGNLRRFGYRQHAAHLSKRWKSVQLFCEIKYDLLKINAADALP